MTAPDTTGTTAAEEPPAPNCCPYCGTTAHGGGAGLHDCTPIGGQDGNEFTGGLSAHDFTDGAYLPTSPAAPPLMPRMDTGQRTEISAACDKATEALTVLFADFSAQIDACRPVIVLDNGVTSPLTEAVVELILDNWVAAAQERVRG